MTPISTPASELLRWQFRLGHRLLDSMIDGVSGETVCQGPVPVAVCYARVVLCEDFSVNGILTDAKPLALTSWAGRTGLSELPPVGGWFEWRGWARQVQIDLVDVRRYAGAVFSSTDTCIANLSETSWDLTCGDAPVRLLSALLMTLSMQHGELACLQRLEPERLC